MAIDGSSKGATAFFVLIDVHVVLVSIRRSHCLHPSHCFGKSCLCEGLLG